VQFKESPRAIEADVRRELLPVFVCGHSGPMHSYDVSNSLTDWQILKLISEEDDRNKVDDSCTVHSLSHVSDFKGDQVFLGFARLMRECGIEHNRIEVDIFSYVALRQLLVDVASLFILDFD